MDMTFGTWNVRSLYRVGLPNDSFEETVHRLDLVGVQEVRWEGSGTVSAGEYTFFYGKGNENHELGIGYRYRYVTYVFVHFLVVSLSLG
jgi:hypothetical protein